MCRTPFVHICVCFCIAGHRHRHSGIQHLSPVPEHSGTGLGPLVPVQDWFRHLHYFSFLDQTDRMPDILAFKNERCTPCASILYWWWTGRQSARPWTFWCWQIINILECREKVSPASAFWPVVSCISPASSAFRYQGQSGTTGCGLFWHCPVLVFCMCPR